MGEALAQRGCAFQMAISRTVLPVGHVSHLALDRVCSSRTTSNALVLVESQRLLEKSLLSHHQIP